MKAFQKNDEKLRWYVMRDLKRINAKEPAYKLLEGKDMEVFVPKEWRVCVKQGKHVREEVPFIQDLLFVHETRTNLDPIVGKIPTLQYRWLRNTWREPMTVPDADMERFKTAVESTESPRYYRPDEVTPQMRSRKIRIIGGQLDGYEGSLVTVRGSKVKRLLVELPMLLVAAVEVNPEYIELLNC